MNQDSGPLPNQLTEHAAQKDELEQPATGGQQDPVKVIDMDNIKPKSN